MGKLNMELLKGIEEQENAIDRNKQNQEEIKAEPQEKQDAPQTAQKSQTDPETSQIKIMLKEQRDQNKVNVKQKKQVFSFRASLDDIATWKAYSTAAGRTMENIGTAAMNEYLKRHKLSGAEQVIFEAMESKNKNCRNVIM